MNSEKKRIAKIFINDYLVGNTIILKACGGSQLSIVNTHGSQGELTMDTSLSHILNIPIGTKIQWQIDEEGEYLTLFKLN